MSLLCVRLSTVASVPAGMPGLQLSDFAALRLQTLSFFLLVLVLCTVGVRLIWNHLAGEFPGLPRLTFKAAAGAVVLWGLVFMLVLTMISGARELMTPGAWERDGLTWRLTHPPGEPPEPKEDTFAADDWNSTRQLEWRRDSLNRMWALLWQHALQHNEEFPTMAEFDRLPDETRQVAGRAGIYYRYVPGRTADGRSEILLYEPEVSGSSRLALRVDGTIAMVDRDWLMREVPPGPEIHHRPPARPPVEAPRPPAADALQETTSADSTATDEVTAP